MVKTRVELVSGKETCLQYPILSHSNVSLSSHHATIIQSKPRRSVPRTTRSTSMKPSQIPRIGVTWRNSCLQRIVSRNSAAHGMTWHEDFAHVGSHGSSCWHMFSERTGLLRTVCAQFCNPADFTPSVHAWLRSWWDSGEENGPENQKNGTQPWYSTPWKGRFLKPQA